MSRDQLDLIKRVRKRYMQMRPIPCTRCGYCMPCPNGVDIPANFDEYTSAFIYQDLAGGRRTYKNFFSGKTRASSCKKCGKCEERCPQKIPISEWMPEVHNVLGLGRPFSKA